MSRPVAWVRRRLPSSGTGGARASALGRPRRGEDLHGSVLHAVGFAKSCDLQGNYTHQDGSLIKNPIELEAWLNTAIRPLVARTRSESMEDLVSKVGE